MISSSSQNKIQNNSALHTATIFNVGVNAVSSATPIALATAFSKFAINYIGKALLTNKLLAFLLINAILEIAPRGILFLLSLINLVFSYCSLTSTEWLMRVNDEEDNSLFCSNDLPLFPFYVQFD